MTPEAEAVAREYMVYRMCEHGWGLFRILDEEGIRHGDVLTEREVVRLLAEHWERTIKADRPAVAPMPRPVKRARPFRMLDRQRMQGSIAA